MFALTMNSTDQVPSHVRITVHQGREILLKNKNGSSELYVSVHVEKEKFVTSFVPKSTSPQWNHTTDVPLMSLDTTIHITVRQKGRISEDFIGYIAIPLRNFTINTKQITHWYKLGSKPGKVKHKLRGDLLVSIQFLSKWTLSSEQDPVASNSPVPNGPRRMLRRSKSDVKLKSKDRDISGSASLIDGKPQNQSKVKERLAVFRRSFRRKNRSPVFQNCEDEFETFSHSASSTPNLRQRTHTFDSASSLGAKTGHSDSDTGTNSDLSQSPPISIRPSIQALFAEAAALENGSAVRRDDEHKTEKITPAVKFHSFRNKKTRWSMYNIPVTPVNTPNRTDRILVGGTDPSSSSTPTATQQTDHAPSKPEDSSNTDQPSVATDNLDNVTYRAKSHSIARSPRITRGSGYDRPRSYSISDSRHSVRSIESTSEYSGSESATPLYSPQMNRKVTNHNHNRSSGGNVGGGGPESGYNTGTSQAKFQVNQASVVSEESSSPEGGSKTELVPNGSATVASKTTPTKRVVTSPVSSQSPRIRPRMLTYGTGLERRATIAESIGRHRRSTSSPRRLLPATPVQRRERSLVPNRPVSSSDTGEQKKTDSQKIFPRMSSQDSSKMERISNGDALVLRNPNREVINEPDSGERSSKINDGNGEVQATTPGDGQQTSSSSSVDGSGDKRTKHTVLYKESSPLFKKGFQPVSLLPPSLSDYRAQTLPSRGKLVRRHSELSRRPLSGSLRSIDGENGHELSTVPRVRPNRSPENIKLVHRQSMTFVLNGPSTAPIPQSPQGGGTPANLTNKSVESESKNEIQSASSSSHVTPAGSGGTANNSRPTTPSSGGMYDGKTPGEIVTGAIRNRKPSSGLRKAINMYQENRRQLSKSRKTSQENRNSFDFDLSLDNIELDRQRLLRTEATNRASVSAGNSPHQLRRNRSAAETFTHVFKNPFNSLRRTRSQYTTMTSSQTPRENETIAPLTTSNLQTRQSNSLTDVNQQSLANQKTSAPALLASVNRSMSTTANTTSSSSLGENRRGTASWDDQVVHKGENLSPTILVRSPTLTETSSVKTLTGMDMYPRETRESGSPNPASAVGGHSRHTTCGSVESEGFGSITSEELTLEDLAHVDWSHWSKEDLVKELILSKQRHRSTEEELKSIRSYLDNLLLRIMDTNPSLLNVSPSP